MNGLNNGASDDVVECPLCMEPLEVDDLNFYPCTCGYQICRFCWHRIRTDENELCPACRKAYPENPADFTPLTQEEMIAFKSQKRQRDQQRKQKITENRKHLANIRVVQKNLVFVVGLPPRLADADILKKHEYFGKYGKIHKVVINPSTTYAGVQGPSASAYVTYVNNSDALRAIQSVNNINIDGRPIKTSLGTTKYCSHFMKNQQCPKSDCMYLHELGDSEASFTKEEMHQGKHQEYEKRLHETLLATQALSFNSSNQLISTAGLNASASSTRNVDNKNNGNNTVGITLSSSSPLISTLVGSSSSTQTAVPLPTQQKDAWPSLSVSPINKDPNLMLSAKTKKEKVKPHEKLKNEKSTKSKNKNTVPNKENIQTSKNMSPTDSSFDNEKSKHDKITPNSNTCDLQSHENHSRSLDHHEVCSINESKKVNPSGESEKKRSKTGAKQNSKNEFSKTQNTEKDMSSDGDGQRSLSSSSSTSIISSNLNSISSEYSNKEDTPVALDINSGKSSPTSISSGEKLYLSSQQQTANGKFDKKPETESSNIFKESQLNLELSDASNRCSLKDTTAALSNMNLFDDHNSFFTSSSLHPSLLKSKIDTEMQQNQSSSSFTSQLPDLLSGIGGFQNTMADAEGIGGFQTTATDANDLQTAFKNIAMVRHKKQIEEQVNQQQQQQHQMQQLQQQEILRAHDIQVRNNLINSLGVSQVGGPHSELQSNDLNRISQAALLQHQMMYQQNHRPEQLLGNNLFGTNMSKFFDFHKNQQQIHQQILHNGGVHIANNTSSTFNDHLRHNPSLENNRLGSQFLDRNSGLTSSQQLQLQKQRLIYDSSLADMQNSSGQQSSQQNQQQQAQQNRTPNQIQQNSSSVDDDLGFDPFIETQKALAELMENEVNQQKNLNIVQANANQPAVAAAKHLQHQQQQLIDNMQRSRMPPPGFNHMNAFTFGIPSNQNMCKMPAFTSGGGGGGVGAGNTSVGSSAAWQSHLAFPQKQPNQLNETHMQQLAAANQKSGNNTAYVNNDWTTMDPAILSFRQFSFPQNPNLSHTSQQQHDFFMQNIPQQQQQTSSAYAGPHAQLHCNNGNLPNGVMNSQQGNSGQVNANVQGMLEYLKHRQFI